MSAPFNTEITSAAIEPNNRSEGFSFLINFPMNDLFETETKIGYCCLIDSKFNKIWRSLSYQSDRITSYNVCYTKLLRHAAGIALSTNLPTYVLDPYFNEVREITEFSQKLKRKATLAVYKAAEAKSFGIIVGLVITSYSIHYTKLYDR